MTSATISGVEHDHRVGRQNYIWSTHFFQVVKPLRRNGNPGSSLLRFYATPYTNVQVEALSTSWSAVRYQVIELVGKRTIRQCRPLASAPRFHES